MAFRKAAVGVDLSPVHYNFSLWPVLFLAALPFVFANKSNFTSASNFIYISLNSLCNKGHSSRQLQGHVLELGALLHTCVFMRACVWYVRAVNS